MINPFLLNSEPSESLPLAKLPENPLGEYNPFLSLVTEPVTQIPDAKSILYKNEPDYSPITVSTKQATPYIKKGFNVTDIDLKNPNFITDLSDTQSRTDRFANNLKVAGANLVSMALVTGFSNPLDMVSDTEGNLADNTFAKKIFDWSTNIAQDNANYETKDDLSNNLWTNLNNWMPWSNSTKGVGKLLESTAYGIGAGIGIAAQELAVSFATGGSGTLPLLARNIQKLLNSSRYLSEALKVSGIAAKGANNLKNVIQAGEITNGVAKGLSKLYQSQLGSYSEALFEGLEGKESLKTQLIDDYEKIHGFKPIGEELNKIDKTATEAGADRVKLNRLLLSATNLSQFNSIFKAFDARKETAETLAEKFGSNLIVKEGKAVVKDNSKYSVKSTWFDKGIGKAIKPVIEGAVNAGKKDVISEGLQEGLEEGSQFFIDKTLNNYYSWKYKGDNKNISDALLEATNEVFSKEGIESIFTGALSGSGQSLITNFFKNLNPAFKASKVKFKEGQEELAKEYNDLKTKFDALPINAKKKLVNIFNNQSVQGDLHNRLQNTNAAIGVQDIKNNPQDEEQFNQALTHELFTLAEPYVKHQNLDILNQQFDEYKNMDAESFNKLFGTDVKDQSKLVDFYKDEFKKINDSYRKANNAFNTTFNDPYSNAVYNDLRKELAFSLYNNDKLINDAKELETNLGSYNSLLNNYAVNLPQALKDNNKRIKELAQQVEYQPELSKEVDRLLKVNQYIDSVLTKGKELKKEEYIKMLQDNIINPYKVANNITEHIDLDDKLNSLYYLAKIKDRINYQQDKINKILYSDDPVKFLKNAEADYQALIFDNLKKAINTPKENIVKPPVKKENNTNDISDKDYNNFINNNKVSQSILNKIANKIKDGIPLTQREQAIFTGKTKEINEILVKLNNLEQEQELPKTEIPVQNKPEPPIIDNDEIEDDGIANNIESKDYQVAFLVDDDGNVLDDDDSLYNRAKVLSELLHQDLSYEDFINNLDFSYVTVKTENSIDYPLEEALIKIYPKEGINIKYNNAFIGFIPLDDGLMVDTDRIAEQLKDNTLKKGQVSYVEFLQELKNNNTLFKSIKDAKVQKGKKSIPLLFSEYVYSVNELIDNHNKYNKTKEWIKTLFVKGGVLESNFKEEVLNNRLLDYQAFFWGEIKGQILLKDSAIYNKDLPIVNIEWDNINNKNSASFIQGNIKYKREIENYLNSIKDDEGNIRQLGKSNQNRFVFVRTKGVDGKYGWKYFNANARPAINYTDEVNEVISTVDILKDYLSKIRVESSYNNADKGNKLDYSLFASDKGLGVDIKVKILNKQGEEIGKVDLGNIVLNNTNTKKDLLLKLTNVIEKGTDTFKPTTPNIFRQENTKEDTNKSIDTIIINTYFKVPSQVYSTMYLKINPLDNVELPVIPEIFNDGIEIDNYNSYNITDIAFQENFLSEEQEENLIDIFDEFTDNFKTSNAPEWKKYGFYQSDFQFFIEDIVLKNAEYIPMVSMLNDKSLSKEFRNDLLNILKEGNKIKEKYIKKINNIQKLPIIPEVIEEANIENVVIPENIEELPEQPIIEELSIKPKEITLKDVLDNFGSMGYVLSKDAQDMLNKKGEQAFAEKLKSPKINLFTDQPITTDKINPAIFVKGTIATRVKPVIKNIQVTDTIKKCHNI